MFLFLEKSISKWTAFLNKYFDFGSYGETPISKKGSIVVLLLIITVTIIPLFFLARYAEPF